MTGSISKCPLDKEARDRLLALGRDCSLQCGNAVAADLKPKPNLLLFAVEPTFFTDEVHTIDSMKYGGSWRTMVVGQLP